MNFMFCIKIFKKNNLLFIKFKVSQSEVATLLGRRTFKVANELLTSPRSCKVARISISNKSILKTIFLEHYFLQSRLDFH